MDIKKTLSLLLAESGISGNETSAANAAKKLLEPLCDEVYISKSGSVIGVKKGTEKGFGKIMLDAHIDEIGVMISKIDEKGFLKFNAVGGVDAKCLPGAEVVVFGKRQLHGIIGTKPPHLQEAGENGQVFKISDLSIDIGYSAKEANELVSIGDFAGFAANETRLGKECVSSKSLDDRAGVCSILYAAKKLKNIETKWDVYYVFSVGEEVNMCGAVTAANEIEPTAALVVDVTHGITHDNSKDAFSLGAGPSYSLGPNIAKPLSKIIEKTANELGITVYPEVDSGSSGTNAWGIQISKTGVLTAVLSLPLRYMHTSVETVNINDIKSVGEIICAFVRETEKLKESEEITCC